MKLILNWTGGQPFLTQLACYLVANQLKQNESNLSLNDKIQHIIHENIIKNWKTQDRLSHFKDIQNRFIFYGSKESKQEELQSLELYREIFQGRHILFNPNQNEHWDLLISGLVTKDEERRLKTANRIYEEVFNAEWIRSIQQQIIQPSPGSVTQRDKPMHSTINPMVNLSEKIVNIIRNAVPLLKKL